MMEAFAKNSRDIKAVLSLYEFVECVPYETIDTDELIAATEFLAVVDPTKARIMMNYIGEQLKFSHPELSDMILD